MIYLFVYFCSFITAYLARRAKDKPMFLFCSFISISIMIILAGMRDYSIGIDTKNYLNFQMYWRGAMSSSSVSSYVSHYISDGNREVIFAFFIGTIAKLTGNYRVFLFGVHTVIIVCMYIGAFRQKKYINPELVILFFGLLFYQHSLNIMRQYMAMAVVFAFFADIEQRKYVRYCIGLIIAIMIHTAAVFFIAPLLYYIFLYGIKGKKKAFRHIEELLLLIKCRISGRKMPSMKKRMFLCTLIIIGELSFSTVVGGLISGGILNEKYNYYFEAETTSTLIVQGLLLLELVGILFLRKRMKQKNPYSDFWIICTITDLVLQRLTDTVAYGKRLAACFSIINLLTLALMISSMKKQKEKIFVSGAVVSVALVYWWYMYILRNSSETYPYLIGVF